MTAAGLRREPVRESIFGPAYRATTIGILMLVTVIAFEAMAVAAALPTAARDLHAVGSIGWALTGFLVANVVGMVVSGQLNDRTGPRIPTVVGLVAFLAGLVVSGTATTMAQFVAGRVVQGLGGGLLVIALYVILGESYSETLRPKFFAAMSSAWVLPSLLGPVVAGSLAQHASWRWAFFGLIPVACVGAVLIAPVLRRQPLRPDPRPMDIRRIAAAIGVAAGMAALEAGGQHPSPLSLAAAAVGLPLLVYCLWSLLPRGTFRVRPGVPAGVVMRGLLAGAFFGVESMIPLSLSVQHGFGALTAGLPLVVTGVTWSLGSWWQGRSAVRLHHRVRLVRIGFVLVGCAAAATAIVPHAAVPGWLIFLTWPLAGIGAGLTMSSAGVLVLQFTTDADRGSDSAALQLSEAVSNALSSGFAGVLVAAAARGALGYGTAFTTLDLTMAGVATIGALVAGRARAPVS